MTYRCLFCSEVLSTDDITQESADIVAAAHHAVCLQRPIKVDDHVELDNGVMHVYGEVVCVENAFAQVHITVEQAKGTNSFLGQTVTFPVRELRRVTRPELKPGEMRFAQVAAPSPAQPGPARIDGLTTEDCLRLFVAETREDPSSVADLNASGYYRLTSAQLVAARALWSERLRAKVAASESERRSREVRVVVTPEVDPWE